VCRSRATAHSNCLRGACELLPAAACLVPQESNSYQRAGLHSRAAVAAAGSGTAALAAAPLSQRAGRQSARVDASAAHRTQLPPAEPICHPVGWPSAAGQRLSPRPSGMLVPHLLALSLAFVVPAAPLSPSLHLFCPSTLMPLPAPPVQPPQLQRR